MHMHALHSATVGFLIGAVKQAASKQLQLEAIFLTNSGLIKAYRVLPSVFKYIVLNLKRSLSLLLCYY